MVLLLVWWLAACSPAYNWRQVRHDTPPGQMLMPCKPEKAQRSVPLLGSDQPAVELWMLSCDVQGHTFAWSALRVPEGADAVRIEQAWRQAAWISLAIRPEGEDLRPTGWRQVDAARPMVRSQWEGPGMNHRGQPLQAHWRWLQSGDWMHLAAIYGSGLQAETVQTFFDSFSLQQP
jgi:hypothetical protein